MSDDFEWSTKNEAVVVPPRGGVAVYWNVNDTISVRVTEWPNDDNILALTREEAEAVIVGLQRALSEGPGDDE